MSTLNGSLSKDIQKVLFSQRKLDKIVSKIAKEISVTYRDKVLNQNEKLVIIGILNGSFQFVSDLAKKIDFPVQIEFMFASSYGNSTKSSGESRKESRSIGRPQCKHYYCGRYN